MSNDDLVLIGNDKGGTISVLQLIDGRFSLMANNEVGEGCSTFAVDSANDLVYSAVKQPEPAIVTLSLDRAAGRLTETSRKPLSHPLASLTRSGDVLLGASYHGGWGATWPVVDGVVGDEVGRVEHRNLHNAVTDAEGRNAYFVSLGDDLVAQFALGADGTLTPLQPPTVGFTPGTGPRHIKVAPDGANAYLISELTAQAYRLARAEDGTLTAKESTRIYAADSGLGTSAFGLDPKAGHLTWGAEIALAGGGRWLLASERTVSTIASIALDDEGHLTDQMLLTPTEEQPRGFEVSPDGEHVIVVGELSGHASLYRLEDGSLVQLDRIETGLGPNWVEFA